MTLPNETLKKVMVAKDLGYAFTCCMCKKLWSNMDRGLDECEESTSGGTCAAPKHGGTFDAYDGPMSVETMERHCYACGKPREAGDTIIEGKAKGSNRLLVCKGHLRVLQR